MDTHPIRQTTPTHPINRPRARLLTLALAACVTLAGTGLVAEGAYARDAYARGHHPWQHAPRHDDKGGVVYVMSNDDAGNQVLVFARARNGRLTAVPQAGVATGGAGAASNAPVDPLGSQNALVYDESHGFLFAVNAGDNTLTVFDADGPGWRPRRTALVDSGGLIPVSLAVSDNLLYVLNAGGSGNVTTFLIGPKGGLSKLGSLDLGLANGATIPFNNVLAPGQVGVDTLARRLIVTNGGGQELLATELDDAGLPVDALVSTPTTGVVPFSFDTTRFGGVLVAEAGSGSVSAFEPGTTGQPLTTTAASVVNGQAASCWIVVHDNGFAYVSNTASDSVSLYAYTRNGALELVDDVAATTGVAPTDMTLAGGGRFLYTLDAGSGEISGYRIDGGDGALTSVEVEGGLPAAAGIQGIAARDF